MPTRRLGIRLFLALATLALMSSCGNDSTNVPDAGSSATSTPSATQGDRGASPCLAPGSRSTPPNSGPDTDQYVGLTEQDAKELAKAQRVMVRVAGRDGECFPLTADYNPDRINLYIESHRVVTAAFG